ncbi:hypothetical protein N7520_006029 [Penicillium odoratum]|uniref:uncharacterized protein n=1 Tax=Penicillium odoratum TaxID=1167516 RepID=UPI002546920C|nr:uncharacterized protein N7520_006029 [Penicillium odoratum]KAJ5758873.1 hypothetical protein N7520_006029 [Penicillium odoratum]
MYKQRDRAMAFTGQRPASLVSSQLNPGSTSAPPGAIYSSESRQHVESSQEPALYSHYPLPSEPFDTSYNLYGPSGPFHGGQPVANISNINIHNVNLGFRPDFYLYDQPCIGQPSSQMDHGDLFSNRYPTTRSPYQGSSLTANSQELNLPSNAVTEFIGSKISLPVPSSQYKYVPSRYSEAAAKKLMIPSMAAPFNTSLQWIAEDPRSKQRHREKRVRTQLEIENRKEDIQKLKQFGGACLWCHRSKKKCDPAQNCELCRANKRRCIRSHSQLCLIGQVEPSTKQNSIPYFGPPSQEALSAMRLMADNAFSDRPTVKVCLYIQHANGLKGLEMTKDDMDPRRTETQRLINDFNYLMSTCMQSLDLETLSETYPGHLLVSPVIRMTRLYMIIRSLATTRIHLCSSDTNLAQLILLLVLIVSIQSLVRMSESFSIDLCEALRRRNTETTRPNQKRRQHKGTSNKSSLSVTMELYCKLVVGLLNLIESPVIALIFKHFDTQLLEVRDNLKGILASMNSIHSKRAKGAIKRGPDEEVPPFPPAQHFELAFRVESLDTNGYSESTRANDQCYIEVPEQAIHDVETFLQSGIDNLETFQNPLTKDPKSLVLDEAPTQSVSTETATDITSHTEFLDTPSIESDTFDEILGSAPWDWADDDLYSSMMYYP